MPPPPSPYLATSLYLVKSDLGYMQPRLNVLVVAVNGVHSDEGVRDVSNSKISASVTSDMHDDDAQQQQQQLDDPRVHHRPPPTVDLQPSNARTAFAPTRSDADFCRSTDASSEQSEAQSGSSVRGSGNDGPATTVSGDVRNKKVVRDGPPSENYRTPHGASDDGVSVAEKRAPPVRFRGIGPTDEETGVPIASRTVSKTIAEFYFSNVV